MNTKETLNKIKQDFPKVYNELTINSDLMLQAKEYNRKDDVAYYKGQIKGIANALWLTGHISVTSSSKLFIYFATVRS